MVFLRSRWDCQNLFITVRYFVVRRKLFRIDQHTREEELRGLSSQNEAN